MFLDTVRKQILKRETQFMLCGSGTPLVKRAGIGQDTGQNDLNFKKICRWVDFAGLYEVSLKSCSREQRKTELGNAVDKAV